MGVGWLTLISFSSCWNQFINQPYLVNSPFNSSAPLNATPMSCWGCGNFSPLFCCVMMEILFVLQKNYKNNMMLSQIWSSVSSHHRYLLQRHKRPFINSSWLRHQIKLQMGGWNLAKVLLFSEDWLHSCTRSFRSSSAEGGLPIWLNTRKQLQQKRLPSHLLRRQTGQR